MNEETPSDASEYVRLEADLAAPPSEESAWLRPLQSGTSGPFVVLVAEADVELRTAVAQRLAERLATGPAHRPVHIEEAGTFEEVVARLRRGGIAILVRGRLLRSGDPTLLDQALYDEPMFRVRSSLLVADGAGIDPSAMLREPLQAVSLCEAVAHLLEHTQSQTASNHPPPLPE